VERLPVVVAAARLRLAQRQFRMLVAMVVTVLRRLSAERRSCMRVAAVLVASRRRVRVVLAVVGMVRLPMP